MILLKPASLLTVSLLVVVYGVAQGQRRSVSHQRKKSPAATKPNTVETPAGVVMIKARSGETLASIAARFRVPVGELEKLNGIKPNVPLQVGRDIKLPIPASSASPPKLAPPSVTLDADKMNARVKQIIDDAETRFKEGERNLKANEREQAREKFDRAVDTILESGINVAGYPRLETYYLELVERIYRLEVPQQQKPSSTETTQPVAVNYTGQEQNQQSEPQQEAGFKQQKFEPSLLDELSKLILTPLNPISKCYIKNLQVRGLRLGMSLDEVKRMMPELRDSPADSVGYKNLLFTIKPRNAPQPKIKIEVSGVTKIQIHFLDNKVITVKLFYDDSVMWPSTSEFASRISDALGLGGAWSTVNVSPADISYLYRDGAIKRMECSGTRFDVGLFSSKLIDPDDRKPITSFLEIRDVSGEIELNNRRVAEAERIRQEKLRKEEERRKAFKP